MTPGWDSHHDAGMGAEREEKPKRHNDSGRIPGPGGFSPASLDALRELLLFKDLQISHQNFTLGFGAQEYPDD
jgi:hypothetical protein